MKGRRLVAALGFLAVFTATSTGYASLTLVSAEMSGRSGGGGVSGFVPIPVQETRYGPIPFPNDAQNFAGFTADGLKVLVNRPGSYSGNTHLGTYLRYWNQHSFKVVFDLDEPAAYTYHASRGANTAFVALVSLAAEGQREIPALLQGDASGVLPPGRYTFQGGSGVAGYEPPNGPFSSVSNLTDMWLTVAPEPSSLSVVAVSLALIARRPRRFSAAPA
jgi:hypothetical protein